MWEMSRTKRRNWIVGGVLLLVLIFVIADKTKEYQISSDKKYAEQMKKAFEDWMKSKFYVLELQEEDSDILGSESRTKFNRLMDKTNQQLGNNEKINKKQIEKEMESIMEGFLLPSEMVEQLIQHPLSGNREQSELFMQEYFKNVLALQDAYYNKFLAYEEVFINTDISDPYWVDRFPHSLKTLVDAMFIQNIDAALYTETGEYIPFYAENSVSSQIRSSIHEDNVGYLAALEVESMYVYRSPYKSSMDDLVEKMIEIEDVLLSIEPSHTRLYSNLLSTYNNLLHTSLLDVDDKFGRYDEDGQLKENYRAAWELIATNDEEESPSALIVKKVLKELENNGWNRNELPNYFFHYDLSRAVDLARQGKLKEYEWDKYLPKGN